MGKTLDYWEPARKAIFAEPKFIKQCAKYNADKMSLAALSSLEPYLANPEFTSAAVRGSAPRVYVHTNGCTKKIRFI